MMATLNLSASEERIRARLATMLVEADLDRELAEATAADAVRRLEQFCARIEAARKELDALAKQDRINDPMIELSGVFAALAGEAP